MNKSKTINNENTLVLSGASTANLYESRRTGEYPFVGPKYKSVESIRANMKGIKNVIIVSDEGATLMFSFEGPNSIKKINYKTLNFIFGDSSNIPRHKFVINFKGKCQIFHDKNTISLFTDVFDMNKNKNGKPYSKCRIAGGVGKCTSFVNAEQLRLNTFISPLAQYRVAKKK